MTEQRVALTKKQQAIYGFIRKHIEEKGFPPAIRDICTEFGISSPNGVMCHLKALESKGYINRVQKHKNNKRAQARGITIPGVSAGGFSLPLVGVVAAGKAIEAGPRYSFPVAATAALFCISHSSSDSSTWLTA